MSCHNFFSSIHFGILTFYWWQMPMQKRCIACVKCHFNGPIIPMNLFFCSTLVSSRVKSNKKVKHTAKLTKIENGSKNRLFGLNFEKMVPLAPTKWWIVEIKRFFFPHKITCSWSTTSIFRCFIYFVCVRVARLQNKNVIQRSSFIRMEMSMMEELMEILFHVFSFYEQKKKKTETKTNR